MKITPTAIPEVLLIEPQVFSDDRGCFFETYNKKLLQTLGFDAKFVQDNHSVSIKNVLRGLHYQVKHPQGKLVRVIAGEVFDVAVDIRQGSPTFTKWVGQTLSSFNRKMLWIPPGFAHGFYVLSDTAEFVYKTTEYRYAEFERIVKWNDPDIKITWPLIYEFPLLSPKDAVAAALKHSEIYSL